MSNTIVESPTIAVLDGQYHLHTLLAQSAGSRVYRATHHTGHEVAVKIVLQQDAFFDELARYYRADDSPYFCSCIYNYPPQAVSGVSLPLDVPLSRLSGLESDLQHAGILVLEWVDGQPLLEYFNDAGEMEKVDGLMETVLAFRELAQRNLCHGNLQPGDIFLEHETHEIKIVGLGRDPSWWSEAESGILQLGLAEDIAVFARHFMGRLKQSGLAYRRFRRRCMARRAKRRPGLDEIYKHFKKLRHSKTPRRNSEILAGFLRPMHLVSWTALVVFASLALNHLMGDGERPIQKRRADLINATEMDEEEKIVKLRKLYGEAEKPDFRELIADDISQLTESVQGPRILDKQDAIEPIAVLAFKDSPAVVGRHDIVRVGDWVDIGDRYGYVSAIEYNRIKVVFEDAYSWHFFKRPRFFSSSYGNEVVIVWNHENNLDRLLTGVAQVFDLTYDNQSDDAINDAHYPYPDGGKVAGIFVGRGGFETFLQTLNEALHVEVKQKHLVYHQNRSEVPVYYKLRKVSYYERPLEKVALFLEGKLDLPVRLAPSLAGKKVSAELYNVTWQELLSALHLRHSLVKENDAFYLSLAPDENFAGKTEPGGTR